MPRGPTRGRPVLNPPHGPHTGPAMSRSFALLSLIALLTGLAATTGCRTSPPLQPPPRLDGPDWRVREGQALWLPQRAGIVLAGEIIFAAHPDGSFVIEFGKPPIPLVSAQSWGGRWQVIYPTFRKRFASRGAPSAKHLWLWLPTALRGEPLPTGVFFSQSPEQRWRLENTRTGEYIEGFLLPPGPPPPRSSGTAFPASP